MIECCIDARENKMIDLLSLGSHDFTIKMLDLGDIFLNDSNNFLLIERKTWADLHSSIIDSRFREQRSRLQQWKSDHQKFMYIIEGHYSEDYKMEKRTLNRLMIAYSIPVFFYRIIRKNSRTFKRVDGDGQFRKIIQ